QNMRGFASVFAFTFSPPSRLGVCDRLKSFSGTASDFFGFTEVGFPTWSVEFYNPSRPTRPCLVPEPYPLLVTDLGNLPVLFRQESALVRVQTNGNVAVHIGKNFGPNKVQNNMPGPDASNCDLDSSGKVDFSHMDEATCSNACTADFECSEYASFLAQSNFSL